MIFSIYFIFTWLLLFLLIAYNKISLLKNSVFLFMISCLIHTHAFTLIPENFKGFEISSQEELYITYLLNRTLLASSLLVAVFRVFYNKMNQIQTFLSSSVFYAFVMGVFHFTGEVLGIYKYEWWNFYWSLFYFWGLFCFSFLLLYFFSAKGERQYNDL